VSKYKVTYEDLPYVKENGQTTYYNLTMAGEDMSRPTTFVLERSKLAPDQSMAELDRPAIMGLTKSLETRPDQIAIFSERDHGKYDLVRLEDRGLNQGTGKPMYGQQRDLGTLFEKEYVDKEVNKYEERAKQKEQFAKQQELYEKAKNQDKEFKEASIQSPKSQVKEEFKRLELERDERER